jgi:pSer/pThr/pTyr-binding forkhead associated (FHA) protein
MQEKRDVFEEPGHPLRGPYQERAAKVIPLRLRAEPGQRRIVLVGPAAVIGRHSAADVRLAFPEVSRRHCRLAFEQGQWHVYDLNSLNGVFVNDERQVEAPLHEGDRLRVGPVVLIVESGGESQAILQQIADRLPAE